MSGMFSPGLSWPESLTFFSSALPANGWTIQEEALPSETEGEREARWTAIGHGHRIRVGVTTFGGEQGFNMTDFILLQAGHPQRIHPQRINEAFTVVR